MMLKFGISRLSQLKNGRLHTIFGGKKKISLRLLCNADKSTLDDATYESILYEQVDDRGAYKRTSFNRFAKFDTKVIDFINSDLILSTPPLRIHDVGVSSAVTSVDFYNQLIEHAPDFIYRATDYCPELTLLTQGSLTIALSLEKTVVDITYPPFVFTPYQLENPFLYPINHFVRLYLQCFPVRNLLKQYSDGQLSETAISNVNLFYPSARRLSIESNNFTLGQHDILCADENNEQFDCLRAMNVVNDSYFSDKQIQTILKNFYRSLSPNGFLIIGSNQNSHSMVDGGIFVKESNGFVRHFTSGNMTFLGRHIDIFNQSNR